MSGQAPQFIVVPFTGMQICRRLMLDHLSEDEQKKIWPIAKQLGEKPVIRNPLLPLVQGHIACDQVASDDSTGWIACALGEAVFFRLLRIGSRVAIDLVIDTQNGAGKSPGNKIDCLLESGMIIRKTRHHLASFVVEENRKPRGEIGSLIMDFGNTGTSVIYAPVGSRPLDTRPVFFHNPWDPNDTVEAQRPRKEKCILKSTMFVLRVPETDQAAPWIVLGKRAEELVASSDPHITSLYAPKKYLRDWPEHLKAQEPATPYRGFMGQQIGLFPTLHFVKWSVAHMLELVLSSLCNATFALPAPTIYPQVAEVLLTYPLTWREVDKDLFRRVVQDASEKLFVLEPKVREHFRVELICSEPVGVAVYALWEVFFHLFHMSPRGANLVKPSLASSLLGNPEGDQELRVLVVDIGGGSTDIALLEANWTMTEDDTGNYEDVRTRVLESLRFNRAGDRISHVMATALLEFLRQKYKITESLDLATPATNPAFTINYKREVVSKIMELVEKAEVKLARDGQPWVLDQAEENALFEKIQPILDPSATDQSPGQGMHLEISLDVLQSWIQDDFGSIKTRGEPGFMDIFHYLQELHESLAAANRLPHLVILSGRTTRLPFIKHMTARYLSLPLHRVRTLGELLPNILKNPDHENMDKLAVVYGAHRFRFGSPIRFLPVQEEPVFKRFLGTLTETPGGLRLNRVLVKPGMSQPRTCIVRIQPGGSVLLGHSFREKDGRAETIATLSNSGLTWRDAEIDFLGDYTLTLKKTKGNEGLILTEYVPGGTSLIVDNFNDTGRIDYEPEGFLRAIVLKNQEDWIKS